MHNLVSVIIPTYNRAHLIKDAIDTVLLQTYQNFEILIIDDGSTDNTKEVVNAISDSRIKYIYQQNTGKPSVARNVGIKVANGEYVAFLDSDDLWDINMLEKHVNVLDNNSDIGFTTNWSSYRTFDGKEVFKRICLANNNQEYLKYILLNPDKAYTGTGTHVIKKECFDKTGIFDEGMTFCEDWDLFFRIALDYEFYNIQEILTYVRVHQNSISKTNDVTKFRDCYLHFFKNAFENKNLPENVLKIKNQAYSNALWCIGGWALHKSNDYKTARKSFLNSLKFAPSKLLKIKFLIEFGLSFSPKFCLKIYTYLKHKYKSLLGKN